MQAYKSLSKENPVNANEEKPQQGNHKWSEF